MESLPPPIVARLQSLFASISLDGAMSSKTLLAALLVLGLPATESDADALVALYDTQGKGYLSFAEFAEVMKTPDVCLVPPRAGGGVASGASAAAATPGLPDAKASAVPTVPGVEARDLLEAFAKADGDGDTELGSADLMRLVNVLGALADPGNGSGGGGELLGVAVGARPNAPAFTRDDAEAVIAELSASAARGKEGAGLSLKEVAALLMGQRGE